MIGCNCDVGLANTGRPGCVSIFSVLFSGILVPIEDDAGDLNHIDLTSPLPTWSDKVNESDASKRWFPLPGMENVQPAKADTQFEEANSGRQAFLREGKRSISGEFWADDSTTTFLGKLKSNRCVKFGIYLTFVDGSIVGKKVGDKLYPIPVDNDSWDPRFDFATDSTVQKIMLAFDFDRLFDESTMYQITAEEAGINFTELKGLKDVNFTDITSSAGSDEVIFTLETDYGTALNPVLVKGLIAGDFTIENQTTTQTLNPTSVTENPDGTYDFAFTTGDINANDDVEFTINKTGFSGSTVITIDA